MSTKQPNDDLKPAGMRLGPVVIYRFHSADRSFHDPRLFLRTFVDTEHTAKNQCRFAGSFCNPGTFFSLSEQNCAYEMWHYHPKLRNEGPSSRHPRNSGSERESVKTF